MSNFRLLVLFGTLSVATLTAALDSAGNGFLRGDYFVREVVISQVSSTIDIGRVQTIYGTITFDGNGFYQFRGSQVTGTSQAQAYTTSGRYTAGANGLAEIESLVGPNRQTLYGAIGQHAVVASMTESEPQLHDVFIAIPAGSAVTNAALQGRYLGGTIDVLGAQTGSLRVAQVVFDANGQGGLTNVSATGQARNLGASSLSQDIQGATYNLSANGSGTMNYPIPGGTGAANQRLLGGDKVVYFSAGGELLLGGSANGHDLLVAFKAPDNGSNALYNGTYLSSSVFIDPATNRTIWGAYGSSRANGTGADIVHERTNEMGFASYDIAYSTQMSFPSSGLNDRTRTRVAISNQGRHLVWTGKGNEYSFVFTTKAREFSGADVFLNPLGVTNAASYSPVTSAVAPGEFITLFGSGLSNSVVVASSLPFPTNLGGVEVRVNGQAIPLYAVSPTQISGVLPYSIPASDYATFSVLNNGRASNVVTQYTSSASPGVFTIPANGLGVPASLHQDFSLISRSSPARAGETISVYLTGLGTVSPGVDAGAAAPSDPLSRITAEGLRVQLAGRDAVLSYAGLAPGLAGLYQLNITIPTGLPSGDAELWIFLPASTTLQTFLPVQ